MMQAMVLVGVLAICAASAFLLSFRPWRAPGPEEPTGSYAEPTPPVPSPPPVTVVPPSPPTAVAAPVQPSPPLPTEFAPAEFAPAAPVPALSRVSPGRRGRNSGFNRFAPAAPAPVGRITPGVHR